ncbi:hypothetical protein ACFY12_17460 [Streptomyces sp. NPDC001339]|uniref:hypothetical protein n=1 Tax=Streptomyces sp. NPDC001339 TaxID=3364563 RepID=UPI0036D05DDA
MNGDSASLRRLPWTGEDGRPCYLSTDGDGPLSRLADRIEAAQLGPSDRLLGRTQGERAGLGKRTTSESEDGSPDTTGGASAQPSRE